MSSFKQLFNRATLLSEATSPYAQYHPSFGSITSTLKSHGFSSAPLDTINFLSNVLWGRYDDSISILDDVEYDSIKKAKGFSGKKQALIQALQAKSSMINDMSDVIADNISNNLDNFINDATTRRGRAEKYAAQAAAVELAKELRKVKSGKEMDDALTDIVSDEKILVKSSIAKVLSEIEDNLDDPDFADVTEEALAEVAEQCKKVDTLKQLKAITKQLSTEIGYEKIAAYLSSAIGPIRDALKEDDMIGNLRQPIEDEEMGFESEEGYVEDAEDNDLPAPLRAAEEAGVKLVHTTDPNDPALKGISGANEEPEDEELEDDIYPPKKQPFYPESTGTGAYMSDLVIKESRNTSTPQQYISFKDKYKPKTYKQLNELRNYGL